MKKNNKSSFGIIHKVEWFEIKIDEIKFVKYIKKVINLLASNNIPDSASSCSFCEYRKKETKINGVGDLPEFQVVKINKKWVKIYQKKPVPLWLRNLGRNLKK